MKKLSIVFLIILFSNLGISPIATIEASTYYIATDGNDTTGDGSSGNEWLTIQKGADNVSAGDTVVVRDGTYTDYAGGAQVIVSASGNTSNWITFKAENKWGAILDGLSNTVDFGFNVLSSYIRIEDFEMQGFKFRGVHCNSGVSNHHVYVYRNDIHDMGREIVACGDPTTSGRVGVFAGASTHDITIDSNLFHALGRLPNSPSCSEDFSHDHGIYVIGNQTGTETINDVLIVNNIFYDLEAGWGIQVAPNTTDIDIINNTFSNSNPGRDGNIILWCWSGKGITNATIENNIFHGEQNYAIELLNACSGITNLTLRNNLTDLATLYSSSCATTESGNLTSANVAFSNSAGDDYSLALGSDAIDAGLSTNAPAIDIDGISRPQGSVDDIGAYEFTNAPTIQFYEPDITGNTVTKGDLYNIIYDIISDDWVATSTGFYYDANEAGYDGTLIGSGGTTTVGLAEGTSTAYSLDTDALPLGTWFIHGRVIDNQSPPVATQIYAPGTLTINAISGGGTEKIIDNGDAETSSTGVWTDLVHANNYGTNYADAPDTGRTYTYQYTTTGEKNIYLWWIVSVVTCDTVVVDIYDDTTLKESLTVDQSVSGSGGQWNFLGTYTFGTNVKVVLTSGNNCRTIADALKIDFSDVNVAPVATAITATSVGQLPVTIDFGGACTDADGTIDLTSAAVVSGFSPVFGDLDFDGASGFGTYTYTSTFPSTKTDTFRYEMSDNDGDKTNSAMCTVTILSVSDLTSLVKRLIRDLSKKIGD